MSHLKSVTVVQRRRGRRRRRALLAVRPPLFPLVRAPRVPALAPLARLSLALGRRHLAVPLAALRRPREPSYNHRLARALASVPVTLPVQCIGVTCYVNSVVKLMRIQMGNGIVDDCWVLMLGRCIIWVIYIIIRK